mgnify:CR=1 FL=1
MCYDCMVGLFECKCCIEMGEEDAFMFLLVYVIQLLFLELTVFKLNKTTRVVHHTGAFKWPYAELAWEFLESIMILLCVTSRLASY